MPVIPCQLMLLCAGDKAPTEGCRCGVKSVDGNGSRRPYQQVSSQQRMMGSRLQSWEGFGKTLQSPGLKLLERQVRWHPRRQGSSQRRWNPDFGFASFNPSWMILRKSLFFSGPPPQMGLFFPFRTEEHPRTTCRHNARDLRRQVPASGICYVNKSLRQAGSYQSPCAPA